MILAAVTAVPAFLIAGFQTRLEEAISDPLAEYALGNRLRTAWADCIDALWRSPMLGTGPASLHNQMGADSMYFTLAGFWGLAGLVSFLGLLYVAARTQKQTIASAVNPVQRSLAIGLYAGTIGLLINAVTLDTFLSSKIAFPYWFGVGLLTASAYLPLAQAQLARSARAA